MKQFCKNGHEVPEGSKFCPQCGAKIQTKVERKCFSCGNVLSETDKFCAVCGCPAPPLHPSESVTPSLGGLRPPSSPLATHEQEKQRLIDNPFVKAIILIGAIIFCMSIFFIMK